MNYIQLINRFWAMHEQQPFAPTESHLYNRLLNLFSAAGRKDVWPASLRFKNPDLCDKVGLSLNTIKPARMALVDRGLIGFDGVEKGDRTGIEYWLYDEHGQTKRLSKSDSLSPENPPKRLSKSDSLSQKDCQNLTVFPPKDCQILTPTPIISNIETFSLSPNGSERVDDEGENVVEVEGVEVVVEEGENEGADNPKKRPVRGDPFTAKSRAEAKVIPFSKWIDLLGHQQQLVEARAIWETLDDATLQAIWTHTEDLVEKTPTLRYRPLPANYLNAQRWTEPNIDRREQTSNRHRNGHRQNRDEFAAELSGLLAKRRTADSGAGAPSADVPESGGPAKSSLF